MKKNNQIINIVSIGLLSVFVFWTGIALAGTGLISYLGRLTDPNGIPVYGLRVMTFKIYTSPSEGSSLWQEIQSIIVSDGAYNVYLGKVTTIPINIFEQDDLYLEVSIMDPNSGESTPLFPRVELTSVPYAMRALNADMVDGKYASELINDADANPSNEIQTLGKSGNNITLSKGGGSITVPYATNADMVDGKHASQFGDGHSLDAADGSPVNAVYVNNVGNVGIGTTSPSFPLSLGSSLGNTKLALYETGLDNSYGLGVTPGHFVLHLSGSGAKFAFMNGDESDAEEIFTIKGTGNVGIGMTSPSYKLHVNGNAMANNWFTSSDYRLKKNVTPIQDALSKVSILNGVEFEWRTEEYPEKKFAEGKNLGLSSQEVEKVVPEVVSIDDEGYKSISYMNIIPLLIESIKELKNQNEELKKRIETLEQQKI